MVRVARVGAHTRTVCAACDPRLCPPLPHACFWESGRAWVNPRRLERPSPGPPPHTAPLLAPPPHTHPTPPHPTLLPLPAPLFPPFDVPSCGAVCKFLLLASLAPPPQNLNLSRARFNPGTHARRYTHTAHTHAAPLAVEELRSPPPKRSEVIQQQKRNGDGVSSAPPHARTPSLSLSLPLSPPPPPARPPLRLSPRLPLSSPHLAPSLSTAPSDARPVHPWMHLVHACTPACRPWEAR